MKVFFAVIILLSSFIGFAQSKDEAQIKKILADQTDAWNRGDLNGFMYGYWENDSLQFIGKSGVTYGWENTLKNYQKGYPDTAAMGKLTSTLLQVKKLSKGYYHITGKWLLTRKAGNLSGHYTLLFRKINDSWVIVSDHSS